jgi:pyridoxamine 5'-phosphate oxidase
MRELLRSLPVFVGLPADLDVTSLPSEPTALFERWLREAIDEGVPEPHAMTLSTCDAGGVPDARILILKDVDEQGWWFATSRASAKGSQLDEHPAAALTFYWPLQARQVRVRGQVVTGPPERSAADFLARGSSARATTLTGKESQPLADRATCLSAVQVSQARLVAEPDLVCTSWQVYAVDADVVEFWQGDKDRMHTRVQYTRDGREWSHHLLWP